MLSVVKEGSRVGELWVPHSRGTWVFGLGPNMEKQGKGKYGGEPSIPDAGQFGDPEAKDVNFEEMKAI